ncbi:GGDEF domain-containing protein [Rhodococcus sp. IEGM 1401]|uniref:GGDEF domain-containing protein n=1 Tax=unclassified Rhodococcus (in: high G+C Gram-positive bacteria) TaxID=192944 RepID=UPI0022B2CA7F|nr:MULTISPECIES: GGDEF domain-containing protein [unclassified Rhodococcus (in: high G+C Gram-positive bacteria)]MCZ4561085.1 GGDEF domain-containing protein [Rhodococcus sp. IEGM 1401]MDI9921280.1 GGDEF domain-containing protein [Rhodococcus sp. IEGM 1372]MDV8033733.1 GGDEF domain-containing protein [Rhodococcus sp. IEGM 1414]
MLERQASTDELTGLANRRFFMSRLTDHPHPASASAIGLLFIDLDDFKAINDTYGHLVGDQVLIEAGRRLSAAVRDCDIVCRIGGDEFVVLTDLIASPSDLDLLASRVRLELTGRYTPPGIPGGLQVSAAVGSSWTDADTRDRADLLRNADAAMYGMKRRNRGI